MQKRERSTLQALGFRWIVTGCRAPRRTLSELLPETTLCSQKGLGSKDGCDVYNLWILFGV